MACGIVNGVAYLLGGVIGDKVVANVSILWDWQGVFQILAVIALLTSLAAALFLIDQLHPAKQAEILPVGAKKTV